ncbi:MAG: type I 3-dehydroquinate dehydratase [Aigarchaeota archaeon]|nr:type I 3-dehydroquinate dehydratase [Aigarchaeota archaeon]MDW7986264.1 type I 3-dehydroquinate dehydratase [Nitrososphaerota archaeon]
MKPKICVSLKAKTVDELEWKAKRALDIGGDLVELRLDYLANPFSEDLIKLIIDIGDRAIVTFRPWWEGGEYRGEENLRVKLLEELARLKPAYVDIELRTIKKEVNLGKKTRRIISWHSLDKTPSFSMLTETVSEMLRLGDISKIVIKINSFEENLKILRLFKIFPPERLIAFGIDDSGIASRILSMIIGSPITYTCLPGEEVAPGQLTVGEVIEVMNLLEGRGLWR